MVVGSIGDGVVCADRSTFDCAPSPAVDLSPHPREINATEKIPSNSAIPEQNARMDRTDLFDMAYPCL
jgi:hypothetical protein